MKQWKLAGSTAVLALLSASGAFAQVTPEDVWQNWQDMSTAYGQTVSSDSAARDGDTFVVKGLNITAEDNGSSIDSTIDEVRFKDNGDGTVEVTMSETYAMDVTTTAVDDVPASNLAVTISQPGMVVTASGTPDATAYAFTAPSMVVAIVAKEDAAADKPAANINATLTNLAGKYLVAGPADAKTLDSDFTAESLALTVKADDADAGTVVDVTASVANIAGKGAGNFVGIDMVELAEALKAGFTLDANLTYGATSFEVNVTEAGAAPSKITGASEGGTFAVALDADHMQYTSGGKGVTVAMTSPDIPFPEVKLSYAESAFDFNIPVSKSDEPKDFTLLAKVVDLAVSDEIWGMIDPAASLPHDPATLIIDTKGKARLTTDMMDEAAMAALGDAPPGELHALDVTELKAKIAGAELTGSGAFTFDNTDLTTFQGVPAPTGKLDLKLVGGNTLLDKLVAMGLLSEDDAMGARMMMSMFANPGAGADELTSTLEFKDKGFFANGQQLQ